MVNLENGPFVDNRRGTFGKSGMKKTVGTVVENARKKSPSLFGNLFFMTVEGSGKKSVRVGGKNLQKDINTPAFQAPVNGEGTSIVATPRNKARSRPAKIDSPMEIKKSGLSPPSRSGT
jgi:hypothetical protein